MSSRSPQVLSRRANGAPPASSNQNEFKQTKENSERTVTRPGGRGKPSNEKNTETSKSKNHNDSGAPRSSRSKAQNDGGKFVIRRLPPGMTQNEFVSILGSDWDVGKGKVDWFSYANGKTSHDPSKPSRPARAYLHLMRKDDIMALSDAVRKSVWEDAKTTFTSPSLVGPPSLEFSAYKKVPSNKKRADARQGTIDQDPEFMAFLEALASPAPMRESIDTLEETDEASKTETKVTTTPLVEYLKEKKANKAKESSNKNSKQGSKGGKGNSKDDDNSKKRGKEPKTEKAEKPSKETVKILTKKVATEQAAEAAKKVATQISVPEASDGPKNRRAGIAAAARLLQRDLGLSPGSAHRRARQDAAKADAEKVTPAKDIDAAPAAEPEEAKSPAKEPTSQNTKGRPSTPTTAKSQPSGRRNRGGRNSEKNKPAEDVPAKPSATNPPIILKKKSDAEPLKPATESVPAPAPAAPTSKVTPKGSASKPAPSQKKNVNITADATRAFIKHANPSQGVTEAALKQALGSFGSITFVEMDKRKGFAYVDFVDHDSLVKAVTASPVTVAQGSVQVLERKDKKPLATAAAAGSSTAATTSEKAEKSTGRGRRGRGGGGGGNKKDVATNGQTAAPTTNNGGTG